VAIRIGINGFGRIGRALTRILRRAPDLHVVAVNDTAPTGTLAHLLRHDSVAGPFPGTVGHDGDRMEVEGRTIRVSHVDQPAWIPWEDSKVEVVVEATGLFTRRAEASRHLEREVSRVIVSAVSPDADVTLAPGVNEDAFQPGHRIVSTASCTTQAAAVPLGLLDDAYGILAGQMTTVHCYTGSQPTMDLPHDDLRRSRAAGLSMIPTTTSAARGLARVLPHLGDRLSCLAIRVPTATVSLVELVVATDRRVGDTAEVTELLREAAEGRLRGILGLCDAPLVSIDFQGDPRSAIVDTQLVAAPGERLVRLLAWYDNEYGYANRVVDVVRLMARRG
jgi:glyceraldehyde 3-phosphate dehydrogenase